MQSFDGSCFGQLVEVVAKAAVDLPFTSGKLHWVTWKVGVGVGQVGEIVAEVAKSSI